MLLTDKIIYIELHKTGCTHTRKILGDMFPNTYKIIGKHNTYDSISKSRLGVFEEKLRIGNIRNPWDWYVSLWAFGCLKKGGLYFKLTNTKKSHKLLSVYGIKNLFKKSLKTTLTPEEIELWKKLYSDANNHENFNAWLKLILTHEKLDIGENYKANSLSKFAGLLTYRYLKLYTYRNEFNNINSPEELLKYDKNENFMDIIIKNESIHEELLENVEKLNFSKDELNKILKNHQSRTNTSSRDKDYRKYYNDESIALIENYEKLIIDKYSYSFD